MSTETAGNALPSRVVLQAKDVVAAGRIKNMLQVPSPIYTATFTDAHHVLIGAGGGGRKFGMANIALLLRVQSRLPDDAASTSSTVKNNVKARTEASSSRAFPEPPVWSFASAIDLGVDIPWCTTAFLPFNEESAPLDGFTAFGLSVQQRMVTQGLVGFLALSSISAFTLIGVFRGTEPTLPARLSDHGNERETQRRYLRQLARIAVPHDDKDPDKKPIALSQSMLFVAHDSNGVFGYALADLVPDCFEDEDEEVYQHRYAAQLKPESSGDAVLQRRVPLVVTTAMPVANWELPARVNDLSVNRVCIVEAESAPTAGPSSAGTYTQPCKAHLHEHNILAAVLQNKTVVLSTLRLRRLHAKKTRSADDGNRCKHGKSHPGKSVAPVTMETTLTLTGAELPLHFKLLTSSLRLVRLFGWADIATAQQTEMRRQLTWKSLQEHGAPTQGPLCSLMLVAFNAHRNESFIIHGAVEVLPQPTVLGEKQDALVLKLHWAQPQPTPVLNDAITSVSMCTDRSPADYETRVKRSPVGAAVPTHFVVGTVEGWVASVRWDSAKACWHSDHIRPSPLKSVAKRFPALHKEPVACVAVSTENDVVSGDIAQNIALTALPYALRSSSLSSCASATSPKAGMSEETLYVVQKRLAASSDLFPASSSDAGLLSWVMAGGIGGGTTPKRALIFILVPLLLLFVSLITRML